MLPVHKTKKGTVILEGKEYFPASMLAKMNIPDLPKSRAGIYKHAASKGWPLIHVQGKGAKNGVKYFLVPNELISETSSESNKPYQTAPAASKVTGIGDHIGHKADSPRPGDNQVRMMSVARVYGDEEGVRAAIDENMLSTCLAACQRVHGDAFDGLAAPIQMGYAIDLYNLLVKISAQHGGLVQMKRLEVNGLVEQLNVFIRLGWSRKFPPPPIVPWSF